MGEWGEKFYQINSNAEQAKKDNKIINDYQNAAKALLDETPNNSQHYIFNNPFNYFSVSNRKLILNQHNIAYELKATEFFNLLGIDYAANKKLCDKLAKALKRYLILLSVNIYQGECRGFLARQGVATDLIDMLLDLQHYAIIDKNLCHLTSNEVLLLDEQLDLYSFWGYNERKEFYSLLRSYVYTAGYSNYNQSSLKKAFGTKFFLIYNCNQTIYLAYIEKEYDKCTFKALTEIYNVKLIDIQYADTFLKGFDDYVPPIIGELLFKLTNGNLLLLSKLAEVCACVLGELDLRKKVSVILCNQSLVKPLEMLMGLVTDYRVNWTQVDLLCRNDGLKSLVTDNLKGNMANITFNSPLPIKPANYKRLIAIIKGKHISQHDKFCKKLHCVNRIHLVYLTDNHKRLLELQKNEVPVFVVDLGGIKSNNIQVNDIRPDEKEIAWLKTAFVLHGLRCLSGFKPKTDGEKINKISADSILNLFISKSCNVSPDFKVTNKDLYEAYLNFYSGHFGENPLSEIVFCKKIFQTTENISRIRIHKGKQYLRGFKGIMLEDNKIQATVEEKDFAVPNPQKLQFEDHLRDMNSLFRK